MMKINLNGTILESSNKFVTDQWKKQGYKEFKGKPQKEPDTVNPEGGDAENSGEGQVKQ